MCLHNEQKDSLNAHADALNSQIRSLDDLRTTMNANVEIANRRSDAFRALASQQGDLESIVNALIGRVDTLEAMSQRLEDRIEALENKVE